LEPHDRGDRRGQAVPVGRLALEVPPARPRQRVVFRPSVVLADLPLGGDPAFLFELVQRRVERAVAHLQHVAGDLLEALADRPGVERLEREDLEDQEVEGALDEIGWFAHKLGYREESTPTTLGNQGERYFRTIRPFELPERVRN